MAFTMEVIDNSIPSTNPVSDIQIKDGPVFTGYDPNGHTTITGSQRVIPDTGPQEIVKQETNTESTPQDEIRLSTKISAIARKEQALRRRESELKRLEEKIANGDKYSSLKEKIANKDYSAAEELGMTYEEYTQHLLNKQASEDPSEQRAKALEEKLKAIEKAQEEREQREYQANQKLWKDDIAKVVSESEEFSTIKELELHDVVLRHINESFEEDGTELTTAEACKEIEEEFEKRLDKFSKLSKLKKKYEETRTLGAPKPGAKTITQQMTVTSQKPATKPFHLMSESEQIAEAIRRVQAEKMARG